MEGWVAYLGAAALAMPPLLTWMRAGSRAAPGGEISAGAGPRGTRHVMAVLFPEKGHLMPPLRLMAGLAEDGVKVTLIVGEVGPGASAAADFVRGFSPALRGPNVRVVSTELAYDAATWSWEHCSRSSALKRLLRYLGGDQSHVLKMFTVGERIARVAVALARAARQDVDVFGAPDAVVYETFSLVGADLAREFGVPGIMVASTGVSTSYDPLFLPPRMAGTTSDRNRPPSLGARLRSIASRYIFPAFKWVLIEQPQGELRASVGLPRALPSSDTILDEYGHAIISVAAPPLDVASPLHPNVFAVGPLGASPPAGAVATGEMQDWLQEQPARSVVYVSLGSHLTPTASVAMTLCKGLRALVDQGEMTVVWARGSVVTELFPETLACVQHPRIRVEGFVDQGALLRSPAVGVFISHMGAGALGEGALAGVPFVAVPIALDQPYNAARAIDAGIAVPLKLATAKPADVVSAVSSARDKLPNSQHVQTLLGVAGGIQRAKSIVRSTILASSLISRTPLYSRWPSAARLTVDMVCVLALLGWASVGAARQIL